MRIRDAERTIDLSKFSFPEFLLSTVCRDARFPYWVKCTSLGLVLYMIGALCAILTKAFTYFLDYPFLSASLVLGISLTLLAHTTRELGKALVHCNKRLRLQDGSRHRAFNEFVSWVQAWAPMNASTFGRPVFWYYLETLGGVLLGSLMGFYWSHYSQTIWWGTPGFGVSSAFFIAYCALGGYLVGAAVFMIMGLVKILRAYSTRFISADRILALNPDRVGGLKPFGQLLLDLNIALSVPGTAAFVYIGMYPALVEHPYTWLLLVLYTGLLVVVFLVPAMPAHGAMMAAKEAALEKVNTAFLQVNSVIATKFSKYDHATADALGDVYLMYEKASGMSVWPLDLAIAIKLSLTSLYPIVGSLVTAYLIYLMGVS